MVLGNMKATEEPIKPETDESKFWSAGSSRVVFPNALFAKEGMEMTV